ncbi:hypothetical protein J6590_058926 [Homalodisca vitripennis]|nr:hypothetical protein J6590_058926 [Homalodisca vitripennis]
MHVYSIILYEREIKSFPRVDKQTGYESTYGCKTRLNCSLAELERDIRDQYNLAADFIDECLEVSDVFDDTDSDPDYTPNLNQQTDGRIYNNCLNDDLSLVLDSRGHQTPGITVDVIDIINHIKSIPAYKSHYTRTQNP